MINWIDVRDFVVIKHVQISFDPGFTVITGETGAGKSVVVDALAMLRSRVKQLEKRNLRPVK